jgi:hypothetical protein
MNFTVDTDVYMTGFVCGYSRLGYASLPLFHPVPAISMSTYPFESVNLKGQKGILDTGKIGDGVKVTAAGNNSGNNYGRNLSIAHSLYSSNPYQSSLDKYRYHEHKFEKNVLLTKNELYSLTLISKNVQHEYIKSQLDDQPIIPGINMYKVESIALIPQEKANFTGGIVYMKA